MWKCSAKGSDHRANASQLFSNFVEWRINEVRAFADQLLAFKPVDVLNVAVSNRLRFLLSFP